MNGQILVELFAFATPAQKSRATRKANEILAQNPHHDYRLSSWSWEERDAGLYEMLFSTDEIAQIVAAAKYLAQ